MNADSYLLLNSVLGDCPCIDPTLQSAARTAPFAVQALAQQCYYFLHMFSCVKAQLTDTTSSYNTLVQYMAVQQQRKNEEQLGREVSPAPARLTWPLRLPPAQPTSNLELRLTIIGGGSVARCLLRYLLKDTSNEISASPSLGDGADARPTAGTTLLFHPSRITVLTRQPQSLTEFAMKGVRCLSLSHGKAPLSNSDMVVLACQPQHLPEVAKELFTATIAKTCPVTGSSASPSDSVMLEPPVKLKSTTIVVSVLAAVPLAKIAISFHHDVRLILRTEVETPSRLPGVAADYKKAADDCAALQVRYMADRDSFLHDAVEEAESNAIGRLAEEMAAAGTATSAVGFAATGHAESDMAATKKLPKELAVRAALRAATHATVATRFLPPPRPQFLLEQASPRASFFAAAWATLQQAVRAFMLAMAAAEERRAGKASSSGKDNGAALRVLKKASAAKKSQKYRKAGAQAGKLKSGAASPEDSLEAPLVQLCTALAMLPDHGTRRVTVAVLHRYGVLPSSINAQTLLFDAAASSITSIASDGSFSEVNLVHSPVAVPGGADPSGKLVSIPRAYKGQTEAFWKDIEQQFCTVLTQR